MQKSNFLNFLVDETFRIQEKSHNELWSLERKLNDYRINFLRGEFIPQTQLLRFKTPLGLLDIPINWSCFAPEVGRDFTHLRSDNDPESLLAILKSSWDKNLSSLLITQAQGYCYIIGLSQTDEQHFEDLINPQEIFIRTA